MEINEYADKVMKLIDEDINAEVVDQNVESFSELHEFVDANDYLVRAGVPFGADPRSGEDGFGTVNAVCAEVSRRLASVCDCDYNRGLLPWHAEGCRRGAVNDAPTDCSCAHGLHEIAPARGCFHPGCSCNGFFS